MRICTVKATGKLIEMQSNATEGTLLANAVSSGFALIDIVEKEITEAEWAAFKDYKDLATLKSEAHTWINAECARRIFARFDTGKQLSMGMGIITGGTVQADKDWIAATLAVCNNATDVLIPACATEAEIETVKTGIVWTA